MNSLMYLIDIWTVIPYNVFIYILSYSNRVASYSLNINMKVCAYVCVYEEKRPEVNSKYLKSSVSIRFHRVNSFISSSSSSFLPHRL